jgi:hypothetical protein
MTTVWGEVSIPPTTGPVCNQLLILGPPTTTNLSPAAHELSLELKVQMQAPTVPVSVHSCGGRGLCRDLAEPLGFRTQKLGQEPTQPQGQAILYLVP